MKNEKLIRGIGEIDDRVLERYHAIDTRLARKHARKMRALRALAVAASLALLIGVCVPVSMLTHPAGRAVLKGDSVALTEQLNKIEGFRSWQERTAERLEQTLPAPLWAYMQSTPVLDVFTQSQYPAYAWKSTTYGQYLDAPVFVAYEIDDPRSRFDPMTETAIDTSSYTDASAPKTYTMMCEESVYELKYDCSYGQTLQHQAVHVYRLHSTYGTYVAYADQLTGECVYWESPEEDLSTKVTLAKKRAIAYAFLVQKVQDPEAYTLRRQVEEGDRYTCTFTRDFADGSLESCDRVIVTFDRAGHIVGFELDYTGALRYAARIPDTLIETTEAYVASITQDLFLGDAQIEGVVITPDGRLALDCYAEYRYSAAGRYEKGYMRYLAYLTEPMEQ